MQIWIILRRSSTITDSSRSLQSSKPVAPAHGADSASEARTDLYMTSVKMLSGSHAHMSLNEQLHPVVRIVTMRPAPFSGDAFPMKTLPLADSQ
jgi:hypothetical protein